MLNYMICRSWVTKDSAHTGPRYFMHCFWSLALGHSLRSTFLPSPRSNLHMPSHSKLPRLNLIIFNWYHMHCLRCKSSCRQCLCCSTPKMHYFLEDIDFGDLKIYIWDSVSAFSFLTKRRRADQHQFYTILDSTCANYAHNGGVDQSTVTTKLRSEKYKHQRC